MTRKIDDKRGQSKFCNKCFYHKFTGKAYDVYELFEANLSTNI